MTPAPANLAANTTIREALEAWPHLHEVFERHGLGGCGGRRGPMERIDEFARMHRVDLDGLMAELAVAKEHPPLPQAEPKVAIDAPGPLFPPFLVAALAATVTLGASLGAYNLLAIQRAIGPFDPASTRIHATFQVYGFVLLFVVGVAYHVLPRFLATPLALPGVARASLAPLLAGLLLAAVGAIAAPPAGLACLAAGMACIALGVCAFAGVLAATWLRSGVIPELFHRWLMAATAWWLVAALVSAAGAGRAFLAGSLDPVLATNEAAYWAALLGGATGWIQGILIRTSPGFLGLAPARPELLWTAFGLAQLGCLAAVAGALGLGPGSPAMTRDAGLLLTSVSMPVFVLGARLFTRVRPLTASHADAFERAMRFAFLGALLFSFLAGSYSLAALAGYRPPAALFDAGRHALTVGFVTLSIFGMAGRIVPIFLGTRLKLSRLWEFGVPLVFVSMLARICQAPAALLSSPALLDVSSASGPLVALGVAMVSASLLATLAAGEDEAPGAGTVRVEPETRVMALVDAYPQALPILIRAGFTPLANPVARRTVARFATLRLACELHGVTLETLLAELRAACEPAPAPEPAAPTSCSPVADDRMVV